MRTLLIAVMIGLFAAQVSAAQKPDSTRAASALDSLTAVIRSVQARIDSLERSGGAQRQAQPARTSGAYMNIGFDLLADFGWSTEPDVGSLQRGDHDPRVRGFTMPNAPRRSSSPPDTTTPEPRPCLSLSSECSTLDKEDEG